MDKSHLPFFFSYHLSSKQFIKFYFDRIFVFIYVQFIKFTPKKLRRS